ncbi:diguanylate cyclase (GGDEF)-like protein [Pseudonocardia kunmingensis]|uniref:Diguanylate cyclase (GGDEF)-like protein n=1 Tax=Pseudonocardia kunmingensis TaxID=630975 RepID=A0A543DA83_9PSEU|nr:diguanylate cyclase (GGDEF)-like protein [Pseudonocardia kunmingensis]
MPVPRRAPIGVTRWSVWTLPFPVLAVILAVELLALGTLATAVSRDVPVLPENWAVLLAVLVAAGLVSTEASLGVERVRDRSDESPHIDLSSVWAFAAAALLPGALASVVVIGIYGHLYARVWRRTGVPPHRALFSTATVVLAVQAAAAVTGLVDRDALFHTVEGLGAVLLALLAYAAVNMVLVVAVIVLSGPNRDLPTFLHVLAHGDEAVLEFATLSMGALAAGAMAALGPAYAVLVLPPLIVLHRTVLVRQLEEAASVDGKTGLLNAAAWHVRAARVLRRAERTDGRVGLLVLDLDHFKLINDRHGHLVGDHVLAAVAAAVRAEVRDDDLVGRFGGEEFVVLLPGAEGDEEARLAAVTVAERIRKRVAALRVEVPEMRGGLVVEALTVSIGGATHPADGTDLAQLLEVADTAMYAAKRAGRNTVRMGLHTVPSGVTRPTPHRRS